MKSTVDYLGWSIGEVLSVILLLYLLLKNKVLYLPSTIFLTPMLLLTFWSTCTIFWSCNLHASLTGLYKIFFIIFMITVFINDVELWEPLIKHTAILISSIAAGAFLILSPSPFLWMRNPNLFGGFMALGGVCSIGMLLSSDMPDSRNSLTPSSPPLIKGENRGLSYFFSLFLSSNLQDNFHLWNRRSNSSKLNNFKKSALKIASLLIGISLFLIGSLGPILSWIVGSAIQFLLYDRRKIRFFGFFVLILFIATFIPLKKNPFKSVWQRRTLDSFAFERVQIWNDSMNYFSHYPLFGSGLGTFRDIYPEFKKIPELRNAPYAHNEPLNFLCEMGLIGASILVWMGWKLLSLFIMLARSQKEHKMWCAVAATALIHSFFDFNLHYLPILLLFIFSISIVLPKREVNFRTLQTKLWLSVLIILSGIAFSLPGIAWFIFTRFQQDTNDANLRRKTALLASQIDPFNGLYRFESGRMRDLMIAIDLEPRNVWYRREAAQFFLREWERTKEENQIKSALEQYRAILKFAPNVAQFRFEEENILFEWQQQNKKQGKRQ